MKWSRLQWPGTSCINELNYDNHPHARPQASQCGCSLTGTFFLILGCVKSTMTANHHKRPVAQIIRTLSLYSSLLPSPLFVFPPLPPSSSLLLSAPSLLSFLPPPPLPLPPVKLDIAALGSTPFYFLFVDWVSLNCAEDLKVTL